MTSISSKLSGVLSTSTYTVTNELDLNDYDSSSLINVAEKDGTVNHRSTTALLHAKENSATARHAKEIYF